MRAAISSAILLGCVLSIAAAGAGFVSADDRLPGHSHYGEAFDSGPRQSAYLMGETGNVHFPCTTKNPLVQKFVDQGVGQLHGFWDYEAERSFRQAAALDPDCGIAFWGMAFASRHFPPRSRQFAQEAAGRKTGLTDRERMYIDALTNEGGYRAIIAKYPDDVEAKAFEIWRIWDKSEFQGGASRTDLQKALDLCKAILRVAPMHPIHHAVIHITDTTKTERAGLDSAAKCGETAPSIGHMWHMPTHIYYSLKRYPEAAWQLEASIRTENARLMHDHVLPDRVRLYAHNNEWLVRTLLRIGRVHDARRVAGELIDLPRHPRLNVIEPPDQETGSEDEKKEQRQKEVHGTSAYYGRDRLLEALRHYEYWDELIQEYESGHIELTRLPAEQGKVHAALGVAYYCSGKVARGDQELAELRRLQLEQAGLREAALREARQRPRHEMVSAVNAADRQFARPLAILGRGIEELESYRGIVTGFFVSATMMFVYFAVLAVVEGFVFWRLRRRMVTAILTLVIAVGAGVWIFTRHLALLNLPYETTNVDFAFVTRKQMEAGEPEAAVWSANQFANERVNQVRPEANLVELLYRAGRKEDARQQFEMLREMAGTADLDSPPFARLAPIAREFGYPTDWRLPDKIQKSLAKRRSLESLGPLLWRPWSAPDWKLSDADGRLHSLSEFRGKPVILVFFLGRGCLHCKQQLEAFARQAQQFSDAGLSVVAISTDDQAGIKKSLADYKPSPFPFLMLADPQRVAFQSYHAYDDFERECLHGTVLIDPEGFCRWHDESAEPFKDLGFLLAESKRLLKLKVAPVEPEARVIAQTGR